MLEILPSVLLAPVGCFCAGRGRSHKLLRANLARALESRSYTECRLFRVWEGNFDRPGRAILRLRSRSLPWIRRLQPFRLRPPRNHPLAPTSNYRQRPLPGLSGRLERAPPRGGRGRLFPFVTPGLRTVNQGLRSHWTEGVGGFSELFSCPFPRLRTAIRLHPLGLRAAYPPGGGCQGPRQAPDPEFPPWR